MISESRIQDNHTDQSDPTNPTDQVIKKVNIIC